jgi:hypothetical protein
MKNILIILFILGLNYPLTYKFKDYINLPQDSLTYNRGKYHRIPFNFETNFVDSVAVHNLVYYYIKNFGYYKKNVIPVTKETLPRNFKKSSLKGTIKFAKEVFGNEIGFFTEESDAISEYSDICIHQLFQYNPEYFLLFVYVFSEKNIPIKIKNNGNSKILFKKLKNIPYDIILILIKKNTFKKELEEYLKVFNDQSNKYYYFYKEKKDIYRMIRQL